MTFIIIILIVVLAVYFIRKGASSPSQPQAQQAAPVASFEELSDEARDLRRERFDALMRGPASETLKRCYQRVVETFIPDKNGDFKGSLSGLLFENDRAKRLEKVDREVRSSVADEASYRAFYDTLYDDVLARAAQSPQLSPYLDRVLGDLGRGDALLEAAGAREWIEEAGPGDKIKIKTPEKTIKIEVAAKKGRTIHLVKGAYEIFPTGLSFNPMVRNVEILMAVSGMVKGTQNKLAHEDVETYGLPGIVPFGN